MTIQKHAYTGTQFDKKRIAGVVDEIKRQAKAKLDFVYPVSQLGISDDGQLIFKGHDQGFQVENRVFVEWEAAEKWLDSAISREWEGAQDWKIEVTSGHPVIPLQKRASKQLLSRLDIPAKFAGRMLENGNGDLLRQLQTGLLDRNDGRFLVRTMDGSARAILSDSYRILDSSDLFFAAATKLQEAGAEIWDARLWDDGFEMFAASEHISGEVSTDRTFDPGDGWASRWYGESGDAHNAAVRIRNSETGDGGLGISLTVLRRVCANFCVWGDILTQVHHGKKLEAGSGLILSDETRQLEGDVIWSKVKDAVGTAFNEEKFAELIAELNGATEDKIEHPKRAVENILGHFDISEERQESILEDLLGSGDRSRFGLIQSVTAQSHVLFDSNPGEASRLERLGGTISAMTSEKFGELATA